jgi:hypothetical protein
LVAFQLVQHRARLATMAVGTAHATAHITIHLAEFAKALRLRICQFPIMNM